MPWLDCGCSFKYWELKSYAKKKREKAVPSQMILMNYDLCADPQARGAAHSQQIMLNTCFNLTCHFFSLT